MCVCVCVYLYKYNQAFAFARAPRANKMGAIDAFMGKMPFEAAGQGGGGAREGGREAAVEGML